MTNASSAKMDWFATQQKYWDDWMEQQRLFLNGGAPSSLGFQEPWAAFFKSWQNAVGSNTTQTSDTAAFQQYFTKAGESYMGMLQQFYQGTGQAKPAHEMANEWINNLQKFYTGAAQTGKDPFTAMDPFNFMASMPGIGYTREKQEQLNHLYQQWSDYEAKSREYTAAMAKVGLEAVQKFQEYLTNPPQDAAPLKSLKEIYAKWVDVCEDIYAKFAMSEEYTELYGEVVNALMAFKKKQGEVVDDLLDQMNVPTRKEVDSLHERLHALRREVAELKSALKKDKPAAAPAQKTKAKGKKK